MDSLPVFSTDQFFGKRLELYLKEIGEELPGASPSDPGKIALLTVREMIVIHENRIRDLMEYHAQLPTRQQHPTSFKLVIKADIDHRGGLRIIWSPWLPDFTGVQRLTQRMAFMGGSSFSQVIVVPGFKQAALRSASEYPRNMGNKRFLEACLSLPEAVSNALSTVTGCHLSRTVTISPSGAIESYQCEEVEYAGMKRWLETFEQTHSNLLPELRFAAEAKMSVHSLRKTWKARYEDLPLELVDLEKAMKMVGRISEYNKAWYRSYATINLPAASSPLKRQRT